MIADEAMWAELINFNLAQPDLQQLSEMLGKSVRVKECIVQEDPHEKGIRKALNLGHTFGHAFESWALEKSPILHGYAVAFGLIAELYLSVVKTGFPTERMRQTVNFIREYLWTHYLLRVMIILSSLSSCIMIKRIVVMKSMLRS